MTQKNNIELAKGQKLVTTSGTTQENFVELAKGQKLVTTSGMTLTVDHRLGEGTQGIVYQVCIGHELYALKWYSPTFTTENQQQMLKTLVKKGEPNEYFLWPLDIVTQQGLGYLMRIRPSEYVSMTDLVAGRINPTFYHLITACFELVNNFMALHAEGYSYGDISFGNVFLNPNTGKTLVCDNDNVSVNKDYLGSVLGTPRFMAPEIIRGETSPSTSTDQFSLAILLFCMLFRDHPFDGELETKIHCFDEPAMRKLYGNPVYIFDPNDLSNRPVYEIHKSAITYYPIYPMKIKQIFQKAFIDGVNPAKRIQETQWKKEFMDLRDSILFCSHCGKQNFFDVYKIRHQEKHTCWNCQHEMYIPPRLKIGNSIVILNKDTELYPHHLSGNLYDFSLPLAKVSQHPVTPNRWGLTNLSQNIWHITKPDGGKADVPKGKNAPIIDGIKIEFGNSFGNPIVGEVRC